MENDRQQLLDLVNSCQEEIRTLKKENQRLNNVLNELEKELEIAYRELFKNELVNGRDLIKNTLNVLNELKESDK